MSDERKHFFEIKIYPYLKDREVYCYGEKRKAGDEGDLETRAYYDGAYNELKRAINEFGSYLYPEKYEDMVRPEEGIKHGR